MSCPHQLSVHRLLFCLLIVMSLAQQICLLQHTYTSPSLRILLLFSGILSLLREGRRWPGFFFSSSAARPCPLQGVGCKVSGYLQVTLVVSLCSVGSGQKLQHVFWDPCIAGFVSKWDVSSTFILHMLFPDHWLLSPFSFSSLSFWVERGFLMPKPCPLLLWTHY